MNRGGNRLCRRAAPISLGRLSRVQHVTLAEGALARAARHAYRINAILRGGMVLHGARDPSRYICGRSSFLSVAEMAGRPSGDGAGQVLDRVQRLRALGHELRRPHAAPLRDGIHELRVRSGRVQYRMLYFFHDRRAVLSHGCTKERIVAGGDVERAIANRKKFAANPDRHTMRG